MNSLWSLLLLAAIQRPASGNPIQAKLDIQTPENFDLPKIYGKWYDVAIGSTCNWLKEYKHKFIMGTLVMSAGENTNELSTTTTRARQGVCSKNYGVYQVTNIPGKFTYYSPKWEMTIESNVVYTNYDEYAIVLMRKTKGTETTTTVKLYGRTRELRESLLAEFTQFALDQGISRDSIFRLKNEGECIPGEKQTPIKRFQRAVHLAEEGSGGDIPTKFHSNGDACRQGHAIGPCMGMVSRFFYNSSSMTCENFHYGGCLGNANNFHSEKECLQTCRTEAACRLPLLSGPCRKNMTIWAFDPIHGKCITFIYGGCHGNGNRFYSEKECKEYCGVPGPGVQRMTLYSGTWSRLLDPLFLAKKQGLKRRILPCPEVCPDQTLLPRSLLPDRARAPVMRVLLSWYRLCHPTSLRLTPMQRWRATYGRLDAEDQWNSTDDDMMVRHTRLFLISFVSFFIIIFM